MANVKKYRNWILKHKITQVERAGFAADPAGLHPSAYPHQRDAILWALKLGRALIAMSFGLGKTHIQVELARLIHQRTGKAFLVICPLGVKHQFTEEDGPRLGTRWQYVTSDAEIAAADTPYLITNYERVREGNIDPRLHDLAGVSLDEGSVLRSMDSKTSDVFMEVFAHLPFRFVATATPSPNNYKEIIYYARFLGVMDVGQALTRWFARNPERAGDLRLMPHKEQEFWLWVARWALFLYKPSDLGYSDEGYELPPMNVTWHRVAVDHTRAWAQTDNYGQHRLLLDAAGGVSEAAEERRETIPDRVAKMVDIMAEHEDGRHWLLWHDLEDERRAIERALPEAATVYGSQDLERREHLILDFAHGRIPILATKPRIAGSGPNFQRHCHSAIFMGVGYKFQDFIQAVHRIHRFQQARPVDVHIIYAESQEHVVEVLKRKWAQHDRLTEKMQGILRKYGLSQRAIEADLSRQLGVERYAVEDDLFTAVNNDCVLEMEHVADDSVGLIHTSIPFGNHYEYSIQLEDFGYNDDDSLFWKQMDFLIPDLLRVLKPGRVAAIHVKDRILYGHQTRSGFMEVSPFSDECVAAFRKHGFLFEGRRTIVTDVVKENASTYRLGWTEVTKDASKMGSGLPEYLLLFRKPPTANNDQYADEPVTKDKADYTRGRWQIDAHSLWRSNGNRHATPEELAQYLPRDVASLFKAEQMSSLYDYERHVAICEALDERGRLPSSWMLLPPKVTRDESDWVWDDVVYMRTLNSEQARGRKEQHLCPLPFDIVERSIRLYSNPGDLVLDPFGGLGTVAVKAIEMGRKAYTIELNCDYFAWSVRYCEDAQIRAQAPTLFDLMEYEVKPSPNGKTKEVAGG